MKKIIINTISFSIAFWILLVLNGLVIIFHSLVLSSIIPYSIVWAGKLNSKEEMIQFELISISVNIVLLLILIFKRKFVLMNKSSPIINVFLWLFVFVFFLNTIGNLFAKSSLETFIATPLTFIAALLCFRLVLTDNSK